MAEYDARDRKPEISRAGEVHAPLKDSPPGEKEQEISLNGVQRQPSGYDELRRAQEDIGASSGGYVQEDEIEQERLRIHDAQVALVALGYMVGDTSSSEDVDDIWGPEMRDAVASFQGDHNMRRSGRLDAETYERLLAEYEAALEAVAPRDEQDPFAPRHSNEPLHEDL